MITVPHAGATRNRLLATLATGMLEQLLPKFTSVILATRQMLYAPDNAINRLRKFVFLGDA